tara:strand:+ start:26 stop:649 length:624 start_codon:yes stop_codon:yes gene_type:complete
MKESIKIQLPESISDITLEQSQRYLNISESETLSDLVKTKRIVKLFTGLKNKQVDAMTITDYEMIINHITTALNTDVEFTQRFTLDGIEFGFVPNLDEITAGEYIDLTSSGVSQDTLQNILAILFRPIVKEDRHGHYEIEAYTANTKHVELMKQAPMNVVNGMLVFFCRLSNELEMCIVKSTEEIQEEVKRKQVITSLNGDGIRQSI